MNKTKFYQGKFYPKYPQKYQGDITNIFFRSSWEYRFIKWCDLNENVVNYSSEEIIIPYFYPLDGKFHRYFVDFKITVKTLEGLKEFLIEIKPFSQTQKPSIPKKMSKYYVDKINTFIKNEAKWDAAKKYCDNLNKQGKNIEFLILTEHDLNIK